MSATRRLVSTVLVCAFFTTLLYYASEHLSDYHAQLPTAFELLPHDPDVSREDVRRHAGDIRRRSRDDAVGEPQQQRRDNTHHTQISSLVCDEALYKVHVGNVKKRHQGASNGDAAATAGPESWVRGHSDERVRVRVLSLSVLAMDTAHEASEKKKKISIGWIGNATLELGIGQLYPLPGLDCGLLGAHVGQTRRIKISAPAPSPPRGFVGSLNLGRFGKDLLLLADAAADVAAVAMTVEVLAISTSLPQSDVESADVQSPLHPALVPLVGGAAQRAGGRGAAASRGATRTLLLMLHSTFRKPCVGVCQLAKQVLFDQPEGVLTTGSIAFDVASVDAERWPEIADKLLYSKLTADDKDAIAYLSNDREVPSDDDDDDDEDAAAAQAESDDLLSLFIGSHFFDSPNKRKRQANNGRNRIPAALTSPEPSFVIVRLRLQHPDAMPGQETDQSEFPAVSVFHGPFTIEAMQRFASDGDSA